ncbi:MAG: DEAD/DEAH box helicase [Gemmatimonadetes bacterium]|nr:DEAD/DEAH box helicase [Gemmatimonadota bacterium]|tara:strand:+ start:4793 stop:6079 length:1287 start_codon:yes stop_codon:yes gene_type:complete
MQSFTDFPFHPSILQALSDEGYERPTPIQAQAIPEALAGHDVLGTAQTGTGKTAAFSLPILHLLNEERPHSDKGARALILTPTRELALQVENSLKTYGRRLKLRSAVLVGGVPIPGQIKQLRLRPDIIVATPGRLLDLLGQDLLHLNRVSKFVLDEADRMLDMGFIGDVRKIAGMVPKQRQTLFFSATMPSAVEQLASTLLDSPVRIEVAPQSTVADNITQSVLFVERGNKRALLTEMLKESDVERALVFTRTKHRANRISRQLSERGISADAIHGNKTQQARQKALKKFDQGRVKVLVATDIVARGIDVDGISHVINYELPNDPESYVHRIGRTARAGASGQALSLCDVDEVIYLSEIEKLTQLPLTTVGDHPFHCDRTASLYGRIAKRSNGQNGEAKPKGPKFGRGRRRKGGNGTAKGSVRGRRAR